MKAVGGSADIDFLRGNPIFYPFFHFLAGGKNLTDHFYKDFNLSRASETRFHLFSQIRPGKFIFWESPAPPALKGRSQEMGNEGWISDSKSNGQCLIKLIKTIFEMAPETRMKMVNFSNFHGFKMAVNSKFLR